MKLPKSLAMVIFKLRCGMIDPEPRKQYWTKKWKYKFCHQKDQSPYHYIVQCHKLNPILGLNEDRLNMWHKITTLEASQDELIKIANLSKQIFTELKKE